jgi:transcriptional regulator with XRE-family HTH domain
MMKIRYWRKAKGLTAKETAKLFGISRIHLFRLEKGTRALTPDMAIAIEKKTGGELPRSALRPDLWPLAVAA